MLAYKQRIVAIALVGCLMSNNALGSICYASDSLTGHKDTSTSSGKNAVTGITNKAQDVLKAVQSQNESLSQPDAEVSLVDAVKSTDMYIEDSDNNDIFSMMYKDSLNSQIYSLLVDIGDRVGLSYEIMQAIYDISGVEPVYDNKNPNIALDETLDVMPLAFTIGGYIPEQLKQADWYESPDPSIVRPSKLYFPDLVYTVASEISTLLESRKGIDRGEVDVVVGTTRRGKQIIEKRTNWQNWDTVSEQVKERVYFYEAVLQYIGATQEQVDNFYNLYTSILLDKPNHNNTIYSLSLDGQTLSTWVIDKVKLEGYTDTQVEVLSRLFDNDIDLIYSNGLDGIINEYELNYEYGKATVENFAIASMSLINQVRYVWGGGHNNASNIKGISPVWKEFNDHYISTGHSGYCIMPTYTWCPIHGVLQDTEAACIGYRNDTFNNISKYIANREKLLNTKALSTGQFAKQIRNANTTSTDITGHNLDGLDCSGFTCWVYNQLTGGKIVDSTSLDFITMNNFEVLDKDARLYPGDIFSWPGHIVMIVGPATNAEDCKAYVIIEMSPTVVQLSVAYHRGARQSDINKAKELAVYGNEKIGGLKGSIWDVHTYEFETMAKLNKDTGTTEIVKREYTLGRYAGQSGVGNGQGTGLMGAKELQEYTAEDLIEIGITIPKI